MFHVPETLPMSFRVSVSLMRWKAMSIISFKIKTPIAIAANHLRTWCSSLAACTGLKAAHLAGGRELQASSQALHLSLDSRVT